MVYLLKKVDLSMAMLNNQRVHLPKIIITKITDPFAFCIIILYHTRNSCHHEWTRITIIILLVLNVGNFREWSTITINNNSSNPQQPIHSLRLAPVVLHHVAPWVCLIWRLEIHCLVIIFPMAISKVFSLSDSHHIQLVRKPHFHWIPLNPIESH